MSTNKQLHVLSHCISFVEMKLVFIKLGNFVILDMYKLFVCGNRERKEHIARADRLPSNPRGKRGGGGLLRISSDGADRRIFFGLKCSIPGFFFV